MASDRKRPEASDIPVVGDLWPHILAQYERAYDGGNKRALYTCLQECAKREKVIPPWACRALTDAPWEEVFGPYKKKGEWRTSYSKTKEGPVMEAYFEARHDEKTVIMALEIAASKTGVGYRTAERIKKQYMLEFRRHRVAMRRLLNAAKTS